MNFNFSEILTRALQIAWRYKMLWLGGALVSFVGFLSLPINLLTNPSFLSFQNVSSAEIEQAIWPSLLGTGFAIFLSILSIPINVIGMSLPSLGTLQVERGMERLNFVELVKETFPFFWRILGMFLLVGLGVFVVTMVFFACILLLSIVTFGLGAICAFPLFIILIPFVILVYSILEQGMSAVLVDNLDISKALQRAWELVRANLGVMVILSIIIYLGSAIVGMIISIPAMIPMLGAMLRMGTEPDIQLIEKLFRNMILWMLAFSPIYIVFQGFLLTFTQSAWMLTYLRLTRHHDDGPVTPLEANEQIP